MRKRILSLLMVFALCLSMLPAPAYAEEAEERMETETVETVYAPEDVEPGEESEALSGADAAEAMAEEADADADVEEVPDAEEVTEETIPVADIGGDEIPDVEEKKSHRKLSPQTTLKNPHGQIRIPRKKQKKMKMRKP